MNVKWQYFVRKETEPYFWYIYTSALVSICGISDSWFSFYVLPSNYYIITSYAFQSYNHNFEIRGDAFGWGTVLQAGRSRVLLPFFVIGSLSWLNPSSRSMALGWTQPLTEVSTKNIFWGWRRPVRRPDILTTFLFRFSGNPGAPNSWSSKGFSRPVYGQVSLALQLDCITFFYCIFTYTPEFCSHSKDILRDKILKLSKLFNYQSFYSDIGF
jgi:hypothetical protein